MRSVITFAAAILLALPCAAQLDRGAITGTLFGALIVGVFRNGLALAGLQNTWQELTVGLLIIVAVALDQWIRRLST